MGTTALDLNRLLSQSMGDWVSCVVTTNIGASVVVNSTHLNKWDSARDDAFADWWLYIENKNNIGADRKIRSYLTSGGQVNIFGAVLSADTNVADIRLSRYSFTDKQLAINASIREVFPTLHRRLDIIELISNNILPNSQFRDWAVTTVPDKYSVSNATAVANTDAEYRWGGAKASFVSATAANGYMYISSDDYPRLLDLAGSKISFRAWARPSVADDAFLTIYTIKADGTEQTLNSSTTCPASYRTKLELADQTINDDIVKIEFRLRVKTNAANCFFSNARVTGKYVYEYLIPKDFRDGVLQKVWAQLTGDCDDLHPASWGEVYGWDIIDDGTDKYITFKGEYASNAYFRLFGYAPLSTVSATTDSVELEGEKLNLLIAYAKFLFYSRFSSPIGSEDITRYKQAAAEAYMEYKLLLPRLRMPMPPGVMKL